LRLNRRYGLIARLVADDGSVGIGEATVTHADVDAAWTALEHLTKQLVGSKLPRRLTPSRPLDGVSAWPPARGSAGAGTRPAKLAAELALLDLTMTATRHTPAQAWGTHATDQLHLLWMPRRNRATFVRDVADRQDAGDLGQHVVIEIGAANRDAAELTRMQAIAHELSGQDRRISVLVRADRKIATTVKSFSHIDGVTVSPSRWGTWLGARDAARRAKQANPAMMIVLTGSGRGSDITSSALETLAKSTAAVDAIGIPAPAGTWPAGLTAAAGAGLFGDLDLDALSLVADRVSEYPPAPQPEAASTANDYGDEITPLTPHGVPKQTILEVEALKSGFATRRYGRQLFLAEHDGLKEPIGFAGPQSSLTSVAASAIAQHKGMTRDLLTARGLPVAAGGWFPAHAVEKVSAASMELGFPLVLKPADGIQGYAVTTGIRSIGELETALERINQSRYGTAGVVLESMVSGSDYRVLATPDEVISVVRRDPAYVVGDGRHTITELVLLANIDRRRNPYLGRHLMRPDESTASLLDEQGFTATSVPDLGQTVQIARVANLSQGGISTEVLDSTHPSVLDLATRAVASIPGLPYAGIDIFMQDHTRSIDEQDVTIIEINHNPALMLHPYPMFGPPRNVSRELLTTFAKAQDLTISESRDPLAVRLTVFGHVQGVAYPRWMVEVAGILGVDGRVRNTQHRDQIEAVVRGPATRVAAFIRIAFGGPPKAKPVETYAEPVDFTPTPGFVVRAGKADGDDRV
jgi:cyanophycin synthetase